MPLVFRTRKGEPEVFIPVVGQVPADGKDGLPIEQAAQAMPELQTEQGEPLEGAKLKTAAKRFADDRGLEVVELQQQTIDRFGSEEEPPSPADQNEEDE